MHLQALTEPALRRQSWRGVLATLTVGLVAALSVVPGAGVSEASTRTPEARGAQVRLADGEAVAGQYLVALRDGRSVGPTAQALRSEHGGRIAQTYERVLGGFLLLATPAQAQRYAADERVRSVVPDEVVRATAETEPTGVRRIGATLARSAGRTGAGATVAVLDTGIDLDHPDLVANLSPTLGYDCLDPGSAPEDRNGHGTHVAGIIAAASNGAQVVGVAPGATLVPVRVLSASASGSLSALVCGLDYVTRHADTIDVVNVSLGGPGAAGSCTDGGLRQAICQTVAAGVTVVVSAGNDRAAAAQFVPARYPEVITVSALEDHDGTPAKDRLAAFSNGGNAIDLTAPGVSILSTGLGGGLQTMSGTSMAGPHVAGVAALALARDPSLTPARVRALLESTGECPDGTTAGDDGSCAGQGTWAEDRDGSTEPLVSAARAATATPVLAVADRRQAPRTVRRITGHR